MRHAGSFVAVRRLFSSCGMWVSERVGSVVVAHGLSSCGARALERGLSCPAAAWRNLSSLTRD